MSSRDQKRKALKDAIDRRRTTTTTGILPGAPNPSAPKFKRPNYTRENSKGLTLLERKRLQNTNKTGRAKRKLRSKLQNTTYWERQAAKGVPGAKDKVKAQQLKNRGTVGPITSGGRTGKGSRPPVGPDIFKRPKTGGKVPFPGMPTGKSMTNSGRPLGNVSSAAKRRLLRSKSLLNRR